MRRAPSRSRWRLRLLRARGVRRVRQAVGDAANGLLRRVRRRQRAQRPRAGVDPAKKSAKRARQRVLFVFVRRTFGGGRGRRVFLPARAVFGLVFRRLQFRFFRVGDLVWPDCAEKRFDPLAISRASPRFSATAGRGQWRFFAGGNIPCKCRAWWACQNFAA